MNTEFNWRDAKQFSIIQLFLAFAIPAAMGYVGFRMVLPMLVADGMASIVAWPIVASTMLFFFVAAPIRFMRVEAKALNITLMARMCVKRLTGRQWAIYLAIMTTGFVAAGAMLQLVPAFIYVTGLTVPDYMPFMLTPSIDVMTADPETLSPGFPLSGKYFLIPLFLVTLVLNILVEELYFRAWILPKMARFGKVSWVINGTLFALYYVFQFWLFPTILAASLIFAFVIYKSQSILPALAGHFVFNFLISGAGLIYLVLS